MDIITNPVFVPFIQLLLATVFGIILGMERVIAGRMAGPRTYALVAVGACLITIISIQAPALYSGNVSADPLHMIAAIISGVGFIGAGLIIFRDSKISGITTAAGIWVSAAIGIAVGFRMYLLSFFATFLTLFIFSIMWNFENKVRHLFEHVDEKE